MRVDELRGEEDRGGQSENKGKTLGGRREGGVEEVEALEKE